VESTGLRLALIDERMSARVLAISLNITVIVVPNFLTVSAFAVGAYEPPCHSQEDDFLNARKVLEKCVDLLPQVQGSTAPSRAQNKVDSLLCLGELKNLNEKAKPLSSCRNESR
jgi:hypothetical protein